jgi:hypothetical protein
MEPVMVVGPNGPIPLSDAFEGRRMLIVYDFICNKTAAHHSGGRLGVTRTPTKRRLYWLEDQAASDVED